MGKRSSLEIATQRDYQYTNNNADRVTERLYKFKEMCTFGEHNKIVAYKVSNQFF